MQFTFHEENHQSMVKSFPNFLTPALRWAAGQSPRDHMCAVKWNLTTPGWSIMWRKKW